MAAPPITERHKHHFHRLAPIKELVRCATTGNITISTGLNNGDVIDGITLVTGDRVLVKAQSTGAENGIYVVGAVPVRDYDVSADDPGYGYIVLVLQGTANAGTLWQNTNTATPTIGSTALTYAAVGGGGSVSYATPAIVLGSSAAAGAASTVIRSDSTIAAFDATAPVNQAFGDSAAVGSAAFAARRDHKHGMPAAAIVSSGLTQATARLLGRTTASSGAVEEISVGSGLTLSAGSLAATGSGTATITVKDEGSTQSTTVDTLDFVGAGVVASGASNVATITVSGGGGGGLAASVLGYNTVGGSAVAFSSSVGYLKKVTFSADTIVQSVGVNMAMTGLAGTAGMVCLYPDSGGSPSGAALSVGVLGVPAGQPGIVGTTPTTYTWWEFPIGGKYAAGDYWFGIMLMYQASSWNIHYDGSGTDKEVTYSDAGFIEGITYRASVASASRKYSMRLTVLS